MARLVIGTSKAKTVPALVKEVGPEHYIEKRVDANGKLILGNTLIDMTGVLDIGDNALQGAYKNNTAVSGVLDFSDVERVTGINACNGMCSGATGITGVDFSSLETISGNYAFQDAFYGNTGLTSVDLSEVKTISGTSAFGSCFSRCSNLTSFTCGAETISGQSAFLNAFQYCPNLTSFTFPRLKTVTVTGVFSEGVFNMTNSIQTIDFHSLESVSGSGAFNGAFKGKTSITGVLDLSKLKTLSAASAFYNTFSGCTGITGINLSSLETINGNEAAYGAFAQIKPTGLLEFPSLKSVIGKQACSYMFSGSGSGITTVKFQSLNVLNGNWAMGYFLNNASGLSNIYFYALNTNSFGSWTNPLNDMIANTSNVTVHFPIRIQATIGSWADVAAGFGGTNTTVLFDIVTSLTGADGNTYARQEKDSTNTATAWVYNDVLYYTSGTTEPVVNDTIYSDAGCTQSVTTITAIA